MLKSCIIRGVCPERKGVDSRIRVDVNEANEQIRIDGKKLYFCEHPEREECGFADNDCPIYINHILSILENQGYPV